MTPVKTISGRRLLCAALPLLAPFTLFAQNEAVDESELVVLSPFEVNTSQDSGYLAGSSTLGGRLNTELKNTPASISVMTKEFIDDIGAYNFTDIAAWVPNAVSEYEITGENPFNDYNVRFRSLSINEQSRNYFAWFVNGDSYNTERVDFARGPNSVVFGQADIGGVGNITTKQAIRKQKGEVELLTTNFGGIRATADYNQPLSKTVAVRVNLLSESLNGWRLWEKRKRRGAHIAAAWNITDTLTLRAEYEYGNINRIVVGRGVFNQWAGWDRQTFVDAPQDSGSFPGGIDRISSNVLVYAPGTDQGVMNLKGFGQTNTGGVVAQMLTVPRPEAGWADDVVIKSHSDHFFAPNTEAENPYYTYSVFANWNPMEGLFFEAAYNEQEQERHVDQLVWQGVRVDVNRVLPDGSPNPHVGEFYADSRARIQNQKNEISDWRIAGAYQFSNRFTEQSILGLVGHRENQYFQDENEFVRVDGAFKPSFTDRQNRIAIRRYESLRDVPWSVPDVDPSFARWVKYNELSRKSEVTYLQAAWTARWLESRALSTTVGLRRDSTKRFSAEDILDPVTREVIGLEELTRSDTDSIRSFTTKSLGAVYRVVDWLSVYGGFAESWRGAGVATDINGASLDPIVNKGLEGGLRMSFFDGRLAGSIAYYDNEKTNLRENGASGDINAIWEDLGEPERSVPEGYSDTSSQKGNGVEIEFVGAVRPGWSVTANISFPDTELTKGLEDTRNYYNANVGEWQTKAAALEDETVRERVLQNIADIEDRINGFPEGEPLLDSFNYTANLFTTYRFQTGRLKGFWFGGGVNIRGKRLEAVDNGVQYKEDGYELYTLTAGYQGSLSDRVGYRIQLNVTNLFDTEVVRASRYRAYTVNGERAFIPRNFLVLDPRRIQLRVRLTF